MFEVVENEGWEGFYPKWFATNGEEYNQFDSEEEAQEYCDERNQQVNEDEQTLKKFIEEHGRPPNTNDFFDIQTKYLEKLFREKL
jgi:protein associated with RNAse G/E